MSSKKKPMSAFDQLQGAAAPGGAPAPQRQNGIEELPMEWVIHSSNVAIGNTLEGDVHFCLLTPIGIKITVPFPKEVWEEICRKSLAPHVTVAKDLPLTRGIPGA